MSCHLISSGCRKPKLRRMGQEQQRRADSQDMPRNLRTAILASPTVRTVRINSQWEDMGIDIRAAERTFLRSTRKQCNKARMTCRRLARDSICNSLLYSLRSSYLAPHFNQAPQPPLPVPSSRTLPVSNSNNTISNTKHNSSSRA